jgi:hypothetical protein
MTVRIAKPPVNIREKLAELERPIGINGQALMATDTPQQAFDLLGTRNRNRIINGDMRIDQRNNGASVTTSSLQQMIYTLDRWGYYNDVISKRTIQRSAVAPVGSTSSLSVTVIATDTVGPQQFIRQHIEGYNISDFAWGTSNAIPITLSFWVRSSVTGQHGGAIQNNNTTRSFPFAYTINSTNTWEYKTINIAGEPSGTWVTDNGTGATLLFENGPGYQKATAGSWVTTNTTSSTGSVNLCAINGATWYITGVQLEAGKVATPFEYRSYGQELALCQRYFWKTNQSNIAQTGCLNGVFRTTTLVVGYSQFPITMRTAPTSTRGGTSDTFYVSGLNAAIAYSNISPTFSQDMMWAEWTIAGGSVGQSANYNGQQSFSAEL